MCLEPPAEGETSRGAREQNNDDALSVDTYLPLFVYGTLRKGGAAASLVEGAVVRRASARAMGRWEDGGACFPTTSLSAAYEKIPGELLWLAHDRFDQTLNWLDKYEGVPTLFRRVRIRATFGHEEVEAYAYEWVPRG